MKRVRFGFRSPLSLLGRTIFPNAGVWVIRIPGHKAAEMVDWVAKGKLMAASVGNDLVRDFVDRIFVEVE